MQELLIAPCGMNCAICAYYLALKNKTKKQGLKVPYCAGCRIVNKNCAFIKKDCELLRKNKISYCFECKRFPCRKLTKLDKRYTTHYHMSMIENQKEMKKYGLKKFLASQKKKWKCKRCGGFISCHNGLCFHCDIKILKKKKPLYRWDDKRSSKKDG